MSIPEPILNHPKIYYSLLSLSIKVFKLFVFSKIINPVFVPILGLDGLSASSATLWFLALQLLLPLWLPYLKQNTSWDIVSYEVAKLFHWSRV